MSERTADVIVIGAGIMGVAAAWSLARRGRRVTVLEQFELGHPRGSSHGAARIFRLVYEQEEYIELAQRTLPLWRELEADVGQELLRMEGAVDIGPAPALTPFRKALSATGVTYEYFRSNEAIAYFPSFRFREEWDALYQAQGALLLADACWRGFLDQARRRGARIEPRTPAVRLIAEGGDVRVETPDGSWQAERVVVVSAGWSSRLLAPLGIHIPISVTLEQVLYFHRRSIDTLLPALWREEGTRQHMYALPNGVQSVAKVGQNLAGRVVDPDAPNELDTERLRPVRDFMRAYLRGLSEQPLSAETCLYAGTPDDDFVLDRVGSIILGIGFGGHGFKFAPLIGELLADLAEGKQIPFQERFAHSRFDHSSPSRRYPDSLAITARQPEM
jgi:sarcosine oxidase